MALLTTTLTRLRVVPDLDLDLRVSADRSQVPRLDEDEFLASGLPDRDPEAAGRCADAWGMRDRAGGRHPGPMGVRVEEDGPIQTVILSRPETRNAVDGPTARALGDAFRIFDSDHRAAVAVLWGEGGTFCSGADLKAITTSSGNRVEPEGDGPMGPTRMRLGKPVIAAISGYAVAGGLELALWCDLRVAESDAVFGVFSRRWGVPLIDGGTVRLARLIGESRAMDLILTGRPVSATEAYEMGLVNRLVGPGEARSAAEALAAEIAGFPQTCLRNDRLAVLAAAGQPEDEAMRTELAYGMNSLAVDAPDGVARFTSGAGRHGSYPS